MASKDDLRNASSQTMRDHHGFLNDGTKASLLRCVPRGSHTYFQREAPYYEVNFFPHYVVLGHAFISSEDTVIRTLYYHFENVDCLVDGSGTFGEIYPARDQFLKIFEADHERHNKILEKYGLPQRPHEPKVGHNPLLFYYSGIQEIASCNCEIGVVKI